MIGLMIIAGLWAPIACDSATIRLAGADLSCSRAFKAFCESDQSTRRSAAKACAEHAGCPKQVRSICATRARPKPPRIRTPRRTVEARPGWGPVAEIPEGPFLRGRPDSATDGPQSTVTLARYFIDRHEVTVGAYRRCVSAGACPQWQPIRACAALTDAHPIACVSQAQASAFCAHHGGRLPSEAQWEKAARGGCEARPPKTCDARDAPTLPWGEGVSCGVAQIAGCGDRIAEGRGRPTGASVYGVEDLIGNVAEWTRDCFDVRAYRQTTPPATSNCNEVAVRGGHFGSGRAGIELTRRGRRRPSSALPEVGLRCVYERTRK